MVTWANVNYALCCPPSNCSLAFPSWPYLGTYYLVVADFILLPISLVVGLGQQLLSWALFHKSKSTD